MILICLYLLYNFNIFTYMYIKVYLFIAAFSFWNVQELHFQHVVNAY